MEEVEEDIENGEHVEHLCGDIELREVDFSYEDKLVFDKLNLKIPSGRVTALIGPSGSGKTTLLNLVERMYPVSGGKILFGGQRYRTVFAQELPKRDFIHNTGKYIVRGNDPRQYPVRH